MKSSEALIESFLAAYLDGEYVFTQIRDELNFMFNRDASFSVKACEYKEKTIPQKEQWIVQNVFPLLSDLGWPKHGSSAFHKDCVQKAQYDFIFGDNYHG